MKCYNLFIAFIFLLSFQKLSSQTVNGNWYGVGKVQLQGSHNDYMSELILQQKNKEVKAIFNYYFKDSLLSDTIKGNFDAATRKLSLQKFPIVYYLSDNTRNSVDCYMTGKFLLRISKTESVLSGSLIPEEAFKYSCPVITINLKKSDNTDLVNPKE